MKYRGHEVSVFMDGAALSEYSVETDDHAGRMTCWIPSEAGKNFSIIWTILNPLPYEVACYPTVDGSPVQAKNRKCLSVVPCEFEGQRTSSSTLRPFLFSSLDTTDDDEYLHNPGTKDIGEIKTVVWQVRLSGERLGSYAKLEEVKVHERAKKAMAHKVGYGNDRATLPVRTLQTTKICRMAEFVFKYRALDFLRAEGIAPLSKPTMPGRAGEKRKAEDSDSGDSGGEVSDHEHEKAKARLEVLRAEAELLASQIADKEKKRSSTKRIKTESRSLKLSGPNEIIDLTLE